MSESYVTWDDNARTVTSVPTMNLRWCVRSQGHVVLQQMHYVNGREEWWDVPTVESPV